MRGDAGPGRVDAADRTSWHADPVLWAGAALWTLTALPSLVPILPPDVTFVFADRYSDAPVLALLLVALVLAARTETPGPGRTFWWLTAGVAASWLAVRSMYVLVPPTTWGTGAALLQDFLYLLGYLLFALALETRPDQAPGDQNRARLQQVEVTGTLLFGGGLLAYFIVIPTVLSPAEYATWVPSLLLYAVLDVCLLARILSILRGGVAPGWARPFGWLALTVVAWLVGDTIEGLMYLGAVPRVDPGTPWDLVWHAAPLALLVAVRSRRWAAPRPESTIDRGEASVLQAVSSGLSLAALAVALPAIHFALSLAGLQGSATRGPRELLLLVWSPGLALLLVYHHHLMRRTAHALEVERRHVSEQLHISQRMEALGRLASGVAHDFANVLSVIRGRAELLRDPSSGRPDQEDASEIVHAADRGQALVGHLLALAKGKPQVPERLDVSDVLRALEPLLRRVLPAEVDLRVQVGPEGSAVAMLDRAHVEQILLNLIVNARDAMPHGGSLFVTTDVVELGEAEAAAMGGSAAGAYAVLAVADTGPGIPPHLRGRVFDPFFTTKGEGAGSGLGLSIVYGIARQANGFVAISNHTNGGALLEVYFPRSGRPHQDRGRVGDKVLALGGETILLVDRDEGVRRTTARLLERAGYRVVEAGTGGEALAILERREPIDMIALDLALPDMPGLGLAARAVEQRPSLATIFMSSQTDKVRPLRIPEGAGTLTKPFSSEALLRTARRLLDERERSVG